VESQALVSYIEKIRYGRNISQEQMLNGIISIRQYRRYLYGKVEIPFGVIAQIATKMGIPPNKLLLEFQEERNRERRLINSFYNAVANRNIELSNKFLEQITEDQIMDDEQIMIFRSALANYKYFIKEITKEEMIEQQKRIVHYPKIMENSILTDSEMIILANILDGDKEEHLDILNRFEMIFLNSDFHISGDNAATMLQIVFWLSKYYGRKKNYTKTIEFCNYGISKNNELRTVYLMEYFYYYIALSFKRLGQITKYKESLYKTILHLEIINDDVRKTHFSNIIIKDLDIDPLTFVRDYINQNKL